MQARAALKLASGLDTEPVGETLEAAGVLRDEAFVRNGIAANGPAIIVHRKDGLQMPFSAARSPSLFT